MEQTKEELLEYAKKHYPIGTTAICLTEYKSEKITSELKWSNGNIIQSAFPETRVYKDGKWAEIVNQIDPMLEIQRQAKEKFPIGCNFINTEGNRHVLLETDETYKINGTNIWAHCGAGCLYSNGKWAYLVDPNYKALQNKAWEVFKDVKEGDKYISTRGDEFTAIKNAIRSEGSEEHNCYIDCGTGFLWEIKDGKELYGTLLPKEEEKWIPKVGDWVVSLEDKGDYRKKGDVFQVLKVSDGCIYYKECVNGYINSFRPAEPHEILRTITTLNEGDNFIVKKVEFKTSIIKDSEEIKIKVKKSKTIKI